MKIKKRKSIKVGSTKFKIKWCNKLNGASFSFQDRLMTIGTDTSKTELWERLVHELSEAVHCELRTRFYDSGNDSFLFVTTHKEFQTHNALLSQLILKFIK